MELSCRDKLNELMKYALAENQVIKIGDEETTLQRVVNILFDKFLSEKDREKIMLDKFNGLINDLSDAEVRSLVDNIYDKHKVEIFKNIDI